MLLHLLTHRLISSLREEAQLGQSLQLGKNDNIEWKKRS